MIVYRFTNSEAVSITIFKQYYFFRIIAHFTLLLTRNNCISVCSRGTRIRERFIRALTTVRIPNCFSSGECRWFSLILSYGLGAHLNFRVLPEHSTPRGAILGHEVLHHLQSTAIDLPFHSRRLRPQNDNIPSLRFRFIMEPESSTILRLVLVPIFLA